MPVAAEHEVRWVHRQGGSYRVPNALRLDSLGELSAARVMAEAPGQTSNPPAQSGTKARFKLKLESFVVLGTFLGHCKFCLVVAVPYAVVVSKCLYLPGPIGANSILDIFAFQAVNLPFSLLNFGCWCQSLGLVDASSDLTDSRKAWNDLTHEGSCCKPIFLHRVLLGTMGRHQ